MGTPVDTTGDGRPNALGFDTTGDGMINTTMPIPGMPQPGMMAPQMPGGYPPQMMPGQPGMPQPGMMPGQPMPGQPMPGQPGMPPGGPPNLMKATVPPGYSGGMQMPVQTAKGMMNVPIPAGLQPGQEFEFQI